MRVNFFLREDARDDAPALPPGISLKLWRPSEHTLPSWSALRVAYWLQARLGMFADERFAELSLWDGGVLIHRLIVTPRWRRFPFMEAGDLQLGALWTHPQYRRRGLARIAMAEAHRLFGGPGQRFWYLADSTNLPSTALALASGYRLAGTGRRTAPLGLRLFGQFQIDRPPAAGSRRSVGRLA
jgi:GNAT superfamily N-acetyltransferase